MAPPKRLTAGSTLVLALVLLTGFALVVSPALAQETTEDGMGGNETMADGTETMMDGNDSTSTESMDDESMTEDSMDDGSMTDDESMTEDSMDDDSMTEEDMNDEGMSDETASGGQPGFGVVVGLAALVGAAGFALYRRRA